MKERDLTTVKGRLLTYLDAKRISQTEFTRCMGLAPNYVNAIRKSLPPARLSRIAELYPDLNREWLIYGTGEMILPSDEEQRIPEGMMVPLLPVEAFAGNLQMWSQGVLRRDCTQIISPIADVDCAIRITGDSMEPEFHDGSTLLLRRINDRSFIPWGQPMVIDSENGVLVKCVYPDGESSIEARSLNPKYPPLSISRNTIYGLYRVVGAIKLYFTV